MPLLHYTQHIPAPLEEVFAFHQDPANLIRITPAKLNLAVTNSEPVVMGKGAEITYQIRWMGIPIGWRTLISEYDPPHRFVDVQAKGPYRKWAHTHTFTADGDSTVVTDKVEYELPFGLLGHLFAGRLVRRQLEEIFAYRHRQLANHFSGS